MNAKPKLGTAQKGSGLRQSDIFESFNPIEMARLIGVIEELEYPKHHVIFSPGKPCDAIFFIEYGRVRLTKLSSDGRTVILGLLGAGDLIGDAAWETAEPDILGETLEETKLYRISKQACEALVRQNPEFGLRLIQHIGLRLKQAEAQIEDLVFRQVPSRVARLLINLAEHHGKVTPAGIKLEFPLTHQEIANMVGSSRVTVTQVLHRFRENEWIDVESKRVTIRDLEALEIIVKQL